MCVVRNIYICLCLYRYNIYVCILGMYLHIEYTHIELYECKSKVTDIW